MLLLIPDHATVLAVGAGFSEISMLTVWADLLQRMYPTILRSILYMNFHMRLRGCQHVD